MGERWQGWSCARGRLLSAHRLRTVSFPEPGTPTTMNTCCSSAEGRPASTGGPVLDGAAASAARGAPRSPSSASSPEPPATPSPTPPPAPAAAVVVRGDVSIRSTMVACICARSAWKPEASHVRPSAPRTSGSTQHSTIESFAVSGSDQLPR